MKDNNTSQVYLAIGRRKREGEMGRMGDSEKQLIILHCCTILFLAGRDENKIIRNELFTIKYFSLAGE